MEGGSGGYDGDFSGVIRGGGNPYDCNLFFAKHTS